MVKLIKATEKVCGCRKRCQELDKMLVERGQKPFAVKEFDSLTHPARGMEKSAEDLGDLPNMVEGSILYFKAFK